MASTGRTSLVSSARATPKGRRDTPNAVVLPKIGVLSTENFSSLSCAEDSNNKNILLQASGKQSYLPVATGNGPEGNFGVHGLVIRELELEIAEPKERTLPGVKGGFAPSSKNEAQSISTAKTPSKNQQTQCFTSMKVPGADRLQNPARLGHPRLQTWPSLQYKMWLDTSNLSLYRLTADNRIARPCSRQQINRASIRDTPRRIRNNGREDSNNLTVGSPEKWQVNSSQAHRPEPRNTCLEAIADTNRDLNGDPGTPIALTMPRLPSRMGRNSLNHFLENLNDESLRTSNLSRVSPRVRSSVKKQTSSTVTEATDVMPSSSQHISILKLKGLVRNPLLGEHNEKQKDGIRKNKTLDTAREQNSKKDKGKEKKHLSFAIPSGSEIGERDIKADPTGADVSTQIYSPPADL